MCCFSELQSITEEDQIGSTATEDDLWKEKYNQNSLLMAMKKEIELDDRKLDPFNISEVLINIIGDLSGEL